jgi:type IV secretion system protein VirB9
MKKLALLVPLYLLLTSAALAAVPGQPGEDLMAPPAPATTATDEAGDPRSVHDFMDLLAGLGGPPAGDGSGAAAVPGDAGAPAAPDLGAFAAALEEYEETGEAPVLGLPTHRAYPYGHRVPVVRCLPLRACDLEFEGGETLAGWAVGDSERWLVEELVQGIDDEAQPHLLVKPTEFDLATNLVVVTDRRTYHLELEAPSAEEVQERPQGSPPAAYDAHLSWWYPDDFVQRRSADVRAKAAARAEARARRDAARALEASLDPRELSFAYRVRTPWRPSRRLGWKPTTVFDDGRRVYLRLPAVARRGELPVILGLLENGGHYPLNARLDGDWLIVPALFERAELILGTGEERRSLRIVATDRGGR